MTGLLTPERLGRPVVDQGHAGEWPRAARPGIPTPKALAPPQPQHPSGELARQAAEVGPVDGLVDRLGAQPALRLGGELAAQSACDLFRTPACLEPVGDPGAQICIAGHAAGALQAATSQRLALGLERPVAAGRVSASGQLAADGRRRPAHQGGDLAHRALLAAQVGQPDTLIFGQVAG